LATGALISSWTAASLTPGIDSTAAVTFSWMSLGMVGSAVVSAMRTTTRVPSMATSLIRPKETRSRE
jgi:hypothetical protein